MNDDTKNQITQELAELEQEVTATRSQLILIAALNRALEGLECGLRKRVLCVSLSHRKRTAGWLQRIVRSFIFHSAILSSGLAPTPV